MPKIALGRGQLSATCEAEAMSPVGGLGRRLAWDRISFLLTVAGDVDEPTIPEIAETPRLRPPFLWRPAAGGGRPADPAVDPGWRHPGGDWARPVEYHRLGSPAV